MARCSVSNDEQGVGEGVDATEGEEVMDSSGGGGLAGHVWTGGSRGRFEMGDVG